MKNFLLVFNVLLLIAVGYLYFVHFNSGEKQTKVTTTVSGKDSVNLKIAYFDLDTLENNYEYFKEQRNYLKAKNDEVEKKLSRLQNDYMAKVNDYNKRGPYLSQAEQTQIQEQLMKMRNDYQQQEQALGQQLQSETMKKMLDIKSKIQDFLKVYGRERGYSYVFATSSDDNLMYYKDSVRDITHDIVLQLNKLNESTKKK